MNTYGTLYLFSFLIYKFLTKITLIMPCDRMSIFSILWLCIVVESNLH